MKHLVSAILVVACAPSNPRVEPAAPAPSVEIAPRVVNWKDRAYHFQMGSWDLAGELHDGRGVFVLAHDGSARPIAMVLDEAVTCDLHHGPTVVVVHIVGEEPTAAAGRKWYGIYTGTPLHAIGAIMSDDGLQCNNGTLFLVSGSLCERIVTITDSIEIEQTPTCVDDPSLD